MTIYNYNPNPLQLDSTLHNLGRTLQSLNNHLENLKPAQKTLHSGDRYLARQEYNAQNDAVFGELAMMGLSSLSGMDALDGIMNIGGGFGEALMEAAQDLYELDAEESMTDLEKLMRHRRRRAYEQELRQERLHETESRKLKNMMTLMAMAVATLEERVKRREKRETIKAFAQNNVSISLKKVRAEKGQDHILTMNAKDIVMEAA